MHLALDLLLPGGPGTADDIRLTESTLLTGPWGSGEQRRRASAPRAALATVLPAGELVPLQASGQVRGLLPLVGQVLHRRRQPLAELAHRARERPEVRHQPPQRETDRDQHPEPEHAE